MFHKTWRIERLRVPAAGWDSVSNLVSVMLIRSA
jgi:hypothetical protein